MPGPPRTTIYIGLGSNVGPREDNLRRALRLLGERGAPVRRVSSFYLSEPVGYDDQPFFYNAVARISWTGAATRLLSAIRRIERRLGRVPTFRNGPRLIDIDLLDVAGAVRARPDPVLPHPRLSDRRFVLVPLAEIAPSWRHPVTGLTAAEMLARLARKPMVRRIPNRKS